MFQRRPRQIQNHNIEDGLEKQVLQLRSRLQILDDMKKIEEVSGDRNIAQQMMKERQQIRALINYLTKQYGISVFDVYAKIGGELLKGQLLHEREEEAKREQKGANENDVLDLVNEDGILLQRGLKGPHEIDSMYDAAYKRAREFHPNPSQKDIQTGKDVPVPMSKEQKEALMEKHIEEAKRYRDMPLIDLGEEEAKEEVPDHKPHIYAFLQPASRGIRHHGYEKEQHIAAEEYHRREEQEQREQQLIRDMLRKQRERRLQQALLMMHGNFRRRQERAIEEEDNRAIMGIEVDNEPKMTKEERKAQYDRKRAEQKEQKRRAEQDQYEERKRQQYNERINANIKERENELKADEFRKANLIKKATKGLIEDSKAQKEFNERMERYKQKHGRLPEEDDALSSQTNIKKFEFEEEEEEKQPVRRGSESTLPREEHLADLDLYNKAVAAIQNQEILQQLLTQKISEQSDQIQKLQKQLRTSLDMQKLSISSNGLSNNLDAKNAKTAIKAINESNLDAETKILLKSSVYYDNLAKKQKRPADFPKSGKALEAKLKEFEARKPGPKKK